MKTLTFIHAGKGGDCIASEIWRPIAGYEGLYEVSDLGRVKSLVHRNNRWKPGVMKPSKIRNGYLHIQLCKDGKVKNMSVHRLVAQAFIPNPQNLPEVNHKDEDKTNNSVSNLEWMTRGDNIAYSRARKVQMFDKQGNLLATFPSMHEAERVTGISNHSICKCCHGKLKSTGGYIWRYL